MIDPPGCRHPTARWGDRPGRHAARRAAHGRPSVPHTTGGVTDDLGDGPTRHPDDLPKGYLTVFRITANGGPERGCGGLGAGAVGCSVGWSDGPYGMFWDLAWPRPQGWHGVELVGQRVGRLLIVDPPAAEMGPGLVGTSLDCETDLGQVLVAGKEVRVGRSFATRPRSSPRQPVRPEPHRAPGSHPTSPCPARRTAVGLTHYPSVLQPWVGFEGARPTRVSITGSPAAVLSTCCYDRSTADSERRPW